MYADDPHSALQVNRNAIFMCPCCEVGLGTSFNKVDSYEYYACDNCDSIFIQTDVIARLDRGEPIVDYDEPYWKMELEAARLRSREDSLARVAEVFYYTRIPIKRFIDIGTGPGYLLDSLAKLLPSSKNCFYGVELFPPKKEFRSKHPNYVTGKLEDIPVKFDAGCCIEVIEHLTPRMLRELFYQLSQRSNRGAAYIFNTAQPEFVRIFDPTYLDPVRRGHIISYSIDAIDRIARPFKFAVHKLPGKSYAFVLEYQASTNSEENILNRIWNPLPENMALLEDPEIGAVLRVLGLEAARGSA